MLQCNKGNSHDTIKLSEEIQYSTFLYLLFVMVTLHAMSIYPDKPSIYPQWRYVLTSTYGIVPQGNGLTKLMNIVRGRFLKKANEHIQRALF